MGGLFFVHTAELLQSVLLPEFGPDDIALICLFSMLRGVQSLHR